jgi:tetratricopeptide (TPR) repeat protein
MTSFQVQDRNILTLNFKENKITSLLYYFSLGSSIFILSYISIINYTSEYKFKRSLDSISQDKLTDAYNLEKEAIKLNPYNEKYRLNFSQLNLFIANNLAQNNEKKEIISHLIQASLSEAKSTVTLNSKEPTYWENYGDIYFAVTDILPNSYAWAIAAYQRASLLDHLNPIYQEKIGRVYFKAGQYKDALPYLTQSIKLKSDRPEAHYYTALNYSKMNMKEEAIAELTNVIALTQNIPDLKKQAEDLLDQMKSQ